MGLLPKTTCRRCHRQYPEFRSRCPYCGTKNAKEVSQATNTTASGIKGTTAHARAESNAKWQMIFGGIILAAIILAVIALISMSLNGEESKTDKNDPAAAVTITPDIDDTQTSTPTPTLTPSPSPTVSVTSITFTFNGAPLPFEDQFSTTVGAETQLGIEVFPVDAEATATWRSSNEDIMTVDQTGLVTGVSSGWATLYVECGGYTAQCEVWVQ